ncbi:tripartite tricarboxylate transporter TctB family protein [Pseudoroseomonas wenyumeiae]|uniref:Tripartite tricarboxylate transporter TctB family protein n=1 Tax=Teichococcus wenyumeiae TaxID=2478470 RepID=A0A3A9JAR4_9PROT|nr:tripartite tricarboxylate transporter TctB family protein [Pseudoroseomonas wenyumeiae]RKK01665.1 tripartite tricarboxylate transporter TctB family protein [Pseudoroseomonas wenyumeiae]RMI17433.1 tripartite tricarboxylate transporter TctB family protein [Pseudoroseomonas wenyumeiae]
MKGTRDYNDIIGGALMMAGGAWFSLYAMNYNLGTLRRMGPAYFPLCIGLLVMLFGLLLLLPALRRPGSMPLPEWRPFLAICTAVLAFALTVERFGLVPATFVLTALAALAELRPNLRLTAVLAVALSAIAVAMFTQGLGIPIPAFRWNH